MRLYLASNDLGNFENKLLDLVGDNKSSLIISNARDHRSVDERKAIVDEDIGILNRCGLSVTELDLRNYFHQSATLRQYIDDFHPGLIFAMGGNLYSLATALHLSGLDDIIRADLAADRYVYGGYSAGAMNASHHLLNYLDSFGKHSDDRLAQVKEIYGEVYTQGLGLIDEYLCPHADEEKFRDVCQEAEASIKSKGLTPIVLNNTDVVIVNHGQLEICRA